jgi:hypothetical protein
MASSSASSSSFETSSRSSFSFCRKQHVRTGRSWPLIEITYMFRFQLVLERDFALVKATESVDFVLVLASDLNLFAASRDLILLRQLLL